MCRQKVLSYHRYFSYYVTSMQAVLLWLLSVINQGQLIEVPSRMYVFFRWKDFPKNLYIAFCKRALQILKVVFLLASN